VPLAYVVLKPDGVSRETSGDALMAWVAERVAPHKRIRHVEFIDQIPKSASGKVLRRVLLDRERARTGAPSTGAAMIPEPNNPGAARG
jgi:acyl-coenzyme A synthetase/AMP-(fatty) acid ligase